MALLAYLEGSTEPVESFSASPEQWASWRELPIGAFKLDGPHGRIPAVLKRSPLGLQFFACAQGYSGITEPKSLEHQMAQVELVNGIRSAGFLASIEKPGRTPAGEAWTADVWAEVAGVPYAFEVQLSQQHWDDYLARTQKYIQSGIRVIWLVHSKHFRALNIARYRHHLKEGVPHPIALNHAMIHMPVMPLDLVEGQPLVQGSMKVVVLLDEGQPPVRRISLGDFGAGVLNGHLRLVAIKDSEERHWCWSENPLQPS